MTAAAPAHRRRARKRRSAASNRARAALLALVLLVICWIAAAPASADVILAEDETDLTEKLAEAQAQQDICYGYIVRLDNVPVDVGSSTGGPGEVLEPTSCPRFARFEADLHYSCDSCEESDSASFSVTSNLQSPPTVADLTAMGFEASDLLGNKDDQAVIDMTGALPLLAAQRGNAGYVDFVEPITVPPSDQPAEPPGSDLLRSRWYLLVLGGFVVLLGPAYWLYARHTGGTRA